MKDKQTLYLWGINEIISKILRYILLQKDERNSKNDIETISEVHFVQYNLSCIILHHVIFLNL